MSQKCSIEYCRAKAGANWDKLFKEAAFREALEVCRWESYAAVLADLSLVAEGYLRPHAGGGLAGLADWLAGAFEAGLAAYPIPAHRPEGWGAEVVMLRRRLADAQLTAPQPVHAVGRTAGNRIYGLLPIHPSLRKDDRELIRNNVRFGLCRSYEDMTRRVEPARMARVTIGETDGGAEP